MTKAKYPYQDLSLRDIKGEIWDDLPNLDGAYEISNFGRVKAKERFVERAYNGGFWVKEKMRKQCKSFQTVSEGTRKIYRLSLTISFGCKKYTCAVARMVYYLFVKKFDLDDRKIKVSMKDEDPFHIRPKNLFLNSTGVLMKKAYELKRRKRESFGKKCKTVSQYSLTGRWLYNFPSISMAAKSIKTTSTHILDSINESEGVASGYIWRYGDKKKDLLKIPKRIYTKMASDEFHASPVSCYDRKGSKIKEYRNVKAAAKSLGVQPNSIRKAIIGDAISANNHYWRLGSGPGKISLSAIQNRIRETKTNIWKAVTQYSMKGERIQTYDSITQAADATGIQIMNISGALRSKSQRTAGGFLWQYGRGAAKLKTDPVIKRKLELQELYIQPVTQYGLDGRRIAIYVSLKKAADHLNIGASFLAGAASGKSLSYSGFYWQLGKGAAKIERMPRADAERKRLRKVCKPVIQYDLSGKMIKEFVSIGEASRETKVTAGQIRKVALGEYKAARGYRWKFKDKPLC